MNLRPINDRVFIRRDEKELTSPGGIALAERGAETPARGTVVAAGPGRRLDNGEHAHMSVKAGDRVLFGRAGVQTVRVGDEQLIVMCEADILAVE